MIGTRLHDNFEDRASELQAQKRQGGQSVTANEPLSGWWSGSPTVGQEVPFAPGTNNRQTVLKLPERGVPRLWTVTLGLRWKPTNGQFFDVLAEIVFGSGGATNTVYVDWGLGSSVSVTANAIEVNALYAPDLVAALQVPTNLRVSAMVAHGARGAGSISPLRTMRREVVANGSTSTLWAVPPFARRVRLIGDVNTYNAASFLTGYADPLGAFPVFNLPTSLLGPQGTFDLPGLTKYVQLTNGSGAGTAVNTIFELQM